MRFEILIFACLLLCTAVTYAWEMRVYPEMFRPDPFNSIVKVDVRGGSVSFLSPAKDGAIHFVAARNGYVSFHLAVNNKDGGEFALTAKCENPGVQVDLFREWFHVNEKDSLYYPDALIPVRGENKSTLPDPQMKIKGQTTAAFFVDVWVSKTAKPGPVPITFTLTAANKQQLLKVVINVQKLTVSDDDAVIADHNMYGVGWVGRYFPARAKAVSDKGQPFTGSDQFFKAVQETYKLLYEHRALLHDLGYNHSGGVTPVFAPEISGEGADRHVKSWDLFDRHFGPLLDGSAFKDARRGQRPIESLYLTINPEWPASYLGWGTPMYEKEFVNVVGEMEKHFREKGWTDTCFELFFNHKKRYKGFEWDGDETRFPKDNAYFKEFGRLMQKAVPAGSPVKFVFRHDASWLMRQQMDDLAGVVDFWVCGGGIFQFYPEAPVLLHGRGDKVWIYGGSASAFGPTADVADFPFKAFMLDVTGIVHWLTTDPGADPWFKFNGGGTCLIFPGDMFGLNEPLPCIRLKLERNVVQDIALLKVIETKVGAKKLRDKLAALTANSKVEDWWNGDCPIKKLEPQDWSNATLGDAGKATPIEKKKLDGRWWMAVHEYAMKEAAGIPVPAKLVEIAPVWKGAKPKFEPIKVADEYKLNLPAEKFTGDQLAQIKAIAELASAKLPGDECWKIVTDRSEKLMFMEDPRDPWAGSDNYDVNFEQFVPVKKALIRMAQLATFPCDANLWMKSRNKPEQVHMVVRQANGVSAWYDFGQMTIDPNDEMKKALAGETVVVGSGKSPNLLSVITPVKNSKGEVVGFVEVCARKQ